MLERLRFLRPVTKYPVVYQVTKATTRLFGRDSSIRRRHTLETVQGRLLGVHFYLEANDWPAVFALDQEEKITVFRGVGCPLNVLPHRGGKPYLREHFVFWLPDLRIGVAMIDQPGPGEFVRLRVFLRQFLPVLRSCPRELLDLFIVTADQRRRFAYQKLLRRSRAILKRRRYQKGRVILRGKANPVWVGRWREDVIGADGVTRRIERSEILGGKSEIPTQRLALRRLEVLLSRVNAPDYRPGRMATLAEFVERWKETVLSQHKPSSQKAVQSHLRHHILPRLGNVRLDALGKEAQQVFVTRLSRTVSRKSARNVMDTLSAILRKAKQWGYICENVDFRALQFAENAVRREPRFFTAKQVQQIIEAAPEPYKTMFTILAMTGMRAAEMLGLQWEDVDFTAVCIHIRRSAWYGNVQTTKSKSSAAPVHLPESLAATLRAYRERSRANPQGFLFVTRNNRPPSSNKVVQYGLWPVLDALKFPRCGVHAFRHTHASLLLHTGATPKVVQEQLRHADPRVTLGMYSHVIGEDRRNAVERVAALLRPTSEASCAQLRPNAPKSGSQEEWIQ